MKKIALLCLIYLFSGCASESKKEEVSTTSESPTNAAQSVEAKPVLAKEDAVDIKKTEKIADSQYSKLNEAIKNQNDEAIQTSASEILTQNPKDVRALNALGLLYYKKGRFEAAQYLLNKALNANSNSAEIYGNLGVVYLAKGERREAIKAFRKALEINPKDALVGANLGSIYVQEKDFNKALMSLEIAVKNGMKDPKVMNNYAITLTANGKVKEASEIFEKILKDNPSQKEAMLNYSILLIEEMQKYKEGLDLLNRLKFVGVGSESRQVIKDLENRAKAGLQ